MKERKLAPFLTKLYELVRDPMTDHIITWEGESVTIKDQQALIDHCNPHIWKISSWSSFVRQLNSYGFRKADKVKNDSPDQYDNPNFSPFNYELLWKMKKKESTKKSNEQMEEECSQISHPKRKKKSKTNLPAAKKYVSEADYAKLDERWKIKYKFMEKQLEKTQKQKKKLMMKCELLKVGLYTSDDESEEESEDDSDDESEEESEDDIENKTMALTRRVEGIENNTDDKIE